MAETPIAAVKEALEKLEEAQKDLNKAISEIQELKNKVESLETQLADKADTITLLGVQNIAATAQTTANTADATANTAVGLANNAQSAANQKQVVINSFEPGTGEATKGSWWNSQGAAHKECKRLGFATGFMIGESPDGSSYLIACIK